MSLYTTLKWIIVAALQRMAGACYTRTYLSLCSFLPQHNVSSIRAAWTLKKVSVAPTVGSSKTLISANEDLQEVFMHVRGVHRLELQLCAI